MAGKIWNAIKRFFSSKDLQLPDEAIGPKRGTTLTDLDEAVKNYGWRGLEEALVEVERERRVAMLRLGDDTGFKWFCRVVGLAAVAFSFGYFFTTDGEIDGFNFGHLGPYMVIALVVGLVGSVYGFMSLADTKREMTVKARDDDRERVLRAIKRIEQNQSTENDSSSSVHSAEKQTVSTPQEGAEAAVDHDSAAPNSHHG